MPPENEIPRPPGNVMPGLGGQDRVVQEQHLAMAMERIRANRAVRIEHLIS